MRISLVHGDCLEFLRTIETQIIDALITDPPAGISFMGKEWDGDKGGRDGWIKWMTEVMQECYRVMKPGAHGLVWAIPRTSHWTATALENAGFEIRDVVTHLFGSGFPKSHNVGKATGLKEHGGLGTALKPASEHWILIRKPCSEKTVAANVLKWGTGTLNIDESRVESKLRKTGTIGNSDKPTGTTFSLVGSSKNRQAEYDLKNQGRFPANLLLSCADTCTEDAHDMFECPIALLDEQSGDSNNVSRFFYCAKASKSDKNNGLDLTVKKAIGNRPKSADMTGKFPDHDQREREGNFHPTVKSTKLMQYLIRMITPPNGVVLDPFMGSGTTGVAAKILAFGFVGIEQHFEYFQISEKRIYG